VQASAGVRYTGVVNNTNFLAGTTRADLEEGMATVGAFAAEAGLPVAFHACMPGVLGAEALGAFRALAAGRGEPVLELEKTIRMDYL